MKKLNWDYTNLAKKYDNRADYSSDLIKSVIRKIPKNANILEIGSGTGKLTKIIINHFNFIHLLEPNNNMLKIGKKNLNKVKKKIFWHNIKAEDSNFIPNTFDAVFFGSSFNVVNKKIIFAKLNKIIKPKGKIVIIWNNRVFQDNIQNGIEKIIRENVKNYKYGIRRANLKKILNDSKICKKIIFRSSKFKNKFLKKDFVNGWKSHGTLWKQTNKKQFNQIISRINKFVLNFNKSNYIYVPYRTKIWICTKV